MPHGPQAEQYLLARRLWHRQEMPGPISTYQQVIDQLLHQLSSFRNCSAIAPAIVNALAPGGKCWAWSLASCGDGSRCRQGSGGAGRTALIAPYHTEEFANPAPQQGVAELAGELQDCLKTQSTDGLRDSRIGRPN